MLNLPGTDPSQAVPLVSRRVRVSLAKWEVTIPSREETATLSASSRPTFFSANPETLSLSLSLFLARFPFLLSLRRVLVADAAGTRTQPGSVLALARTNVQSRARSRARKRRLALVLCARAGSCGSFPCKYAGPHDPALPLCPT